MDREDVRARKSDRPPQRPFWLEEGAVPGEEAAPVELGVVELPAAPANGDEEAVLP